MSQGVVVWVTGLPASGKSTFAARARDLLFERGWGCCLLDGDAVRTAVFPNLGYSAEERATFYESLANLASLVARQGLVALVAATAHRRDFRDRARALAPAFVEVFVDTPREECAARDPKRLYARSGEGTLNCLPGVDERYEAPEAPDVVARGGFDGAALEALCRTLEALKVSATSPS